MRDNLNIKKKKKKRCQELTCFFSKKSVCVNLTILRDIVKAAGTEGCRSMCKSKTELFWKGFCELISPAVLYGFQLFLEAGSPKTGVKVSVSRNLIAHF